MYVGGGRGWIQKYEYSIKFFKSCRLLNCDCGYADMQMLSDISFKSYRLLKKLGLRICSFRTTFFENVANMQLQPWFLQVAELWLRTWKKKICTCPPLVRRTVSQDWDRLQMVWIFRAYLADELSIVSKPISCSMVLNFYNLFSSEVRHCRKVSPCCWIGQPSCKCFIVYWQPFGKFVRGCQT
jgi:hypothetical protein